MCKSKYMDRYTFRDCGENTTMMSKIFLKYKFPVYVYIFQISILVIIQSLKKKKIGHGKN